MDEAQLAELGKLFDEYMYGDPRLPATQQAILIYKSIARDIYSKESEAFKKKYDFSQFVAQVVNAEVLQYLGKRQAEHPVVTPEIRPAR